MTDCLPKDEGFAKKYRVTTGLMKEPVEVWAYSAEDAEYQVQMGFRAYTSGPAYVTKVEPALVPPSSVTPEP